MSRYLVVLTSYFLSIIAVLYAIGSVTHLETTNFFCPTHTEQEVREYNFENHHDWGGDRYGCWYIDTKKLNFREVFDLNIGMFTATISMDPLFAFYCCLYSIAAIFIAISSLYHSYLLIYDTWYAIRSSVTFNNVNGIYHSERNPRIELTLESISNKMEDPLVGASNVPDRQRQGSTGSKNASQQSNVSNNSWWGLVRNKTKCLWKSGSLCLCGIYGMYVRCIKSCFECYFKHIYPWYYVDSKWRMITIIIREWIEILIQFYALLLYGGIHLLDPTANVLSQEPQIIQAFSKIVGVNCIVGM